MTWTPPGSRTLAFIDTETTGLDTTIHEVIEIAIILEHPNGRTQEWSTKIKPERLEDAEDKALEINGYKDHPERWKGAPPLEAVAPAIMQMLEGCILVGQNVGYDAAILERNLARTRIPARRFPYHRVDTVTLIYEHLVPCGLEKLSLKPACDFVGIKLTKEDAHTAMGDVKATRALYHRLMRASRLDRLRWRAHAFRRQFKK